MVEFEAHVSNVLSKFRVIFVRIFRYSHMIDNEIAAKSIQKTALYKTACKYESIQGTKFKSNEIESHDT